MDSTWTHFGNVIQHWAPYSSLMFPLQSSPGILPQTWNHQKPESMGYIFTDDSMCMSYIYFHVVISESHNTLVHLQAQDKQPEYIISHKMATERLSAKPHQMSA